MLFHFSADEWETHQNYCVSENEEDLEEMDWEDQEEVLESFGNRRVKTYLKGLIREYCP